MISVAIQRPNSVCLYDQTGSQVGFIPCPNDPGDGLVGFTGSTVSVRMSHNIHVYDDRGNQINQYPI